MLINKASNSYWQNVPAQSGFLTNVEVIMGEGIGDYTKNIVDLRNCINLKSDTKVLNQLFY